MRWSRKQPERVERAVDEDSGNLRPSPVAFTKKPGDFGEVTSPV